MFKNKKSFLILASVLFILSLLMIIGILLLILRLRNQEQITDNTNPPSNLVDNNTPQSPVNPEVEYKCDKPVFFDSAQKYYYCEETVDITSDEEYEKCYIQNQDFLRSIPDTLEKFKSVSIKKIYFTNYLEQSRELTASVLEDNCTLIQIDQIEVINPESDSARFIKYISSEAPFCFCSGASGIEYIFDFATGREYEINSFGDSGGPMLDLVYQFEDNLFTISPFAFFSTSELLSVKVFNLESGEEILSKNFSLGAEDIPEESLEDINPEYGAEHFYDDKLLDPVDIENVEGKFRINFVVTTNPGIETITVKRDPEFRQEGYFEFEI